MFTKQFTKTVTKQRRRRQLSIGLIVKSCPARKSWPAWWRDLGDWSWQLVLINLLVFFGEGYFDCDKTTDKCVDKSAPDADIDTRYTRWPDAGILIFSYKPWFQQLLPRCQVSNKYWWLKYNIQIKFMEIQYFIHNEIHIYLKSGSCTFLLGVPSLD